MSDLVQFVYVSAASRDFEPADLVALLQKSRVKNDRLELTGMLLYSEGSFFQVLEGKPATIAQLYEQIDADPRHTLVTKVLEQPIETRSFADWTMGFSRITRADLAAITGTNDFFGVGSALDAVDAGRAKRLLEAFRDGGWRKKLAG